METPKPFINNETLREIRNHTDWKSLFHALGLEQDKKSTADDWWSLSPFAPENHASFHINDRGWYCHSTGKGGGVIELVQHVVGQQPGQLMNCYQAGQWLVENGLSTTTVRSEVSVDTSPKTVPLPASPNPTQTPRSEKEKKDGNVKRAERTVPVQGNPETDIKENRPIRQTLLPLLEHKHPELERRGISEKTCEYLGCGFLPESSTSSLAEADCVSGTRNSGNSSRKF